MYRTAQTVWNQTCLQIDNIDNILTNKILKYKSLFMSTFEKMPNEILGCMIHEKYFTVLFKRIKI